MNEEDFNQIYDSYHIIRSLLIITSLAIIIIFFILLLKDIFFTMAISFFLFTIILYHYFVFVYKISLNPKGISLHKLLKTTLLQENIISCKRPTARLLSELKRTSQIGLPNIFGWSGVYKANNQNYFVYSSSTKSQENLLIQYGLDSFIISANNSEHLLLLLDDYLQ